MDRRVIYDAVATAINEYDAECYVAQKYEPIPEQLPCVFIEQISKVRTLRYAALCHTDEQYRLTFEVQVFHETLDGAYTLMEVAEAKFKELGFLEDMCEPIDNANVSLSRIVARFYAQLGA